MRRLLYIRSLVAVLEAQPAAQRPVLWRTIEDDFIAAYRDAHPSATVERASVEWLALAKEVGARLVALEQQPANVSALSRRPILRLRPA